MKVKTLKMYFKCRDCGFEASDPFQLGESRTGWLRCPSCSCIEFHIRKEVVWIPTQLPQ